MSNVKFLLFFFQFKYEEDAKRAVEDLNNRWFNRRPMYAELSPVTDFREACCRQYEMGWVFHLFVGTIKVIICLYVLCNLHYNLAKKIILKLEKSFLNLKIQDFFFKFVVHVIFWKCIAARCNLCSYIFCTNELQLHDERLQFVLSILYYALSKYFFQGVHKKRLL